MSTTGGDVSCLIPTPLGDCGRPSVVGLTLFQESLKLLAAALWNEGDPDAPLLRAVLLPPSLLGGPP